MEFNKHNEDLKREMLLCQEYNGHIDAVGRLEIPVETKDKYEERALKLQSDVENMITKLQEKDDWNLNLIDSLDVDVLSEQVEYRQDEVEVLYNYVSTLIANVKKISAFGINTTGYNHYNVAMDSYRLNEVTRIVAQKLIDAFLGMGNGVKNDLDDIIFDVIIDIIKVRMTPMLYLSENNMLPEDITGDAIDNAIFPYLDAYNDWLVKEATRILNSLTTAPTDMELVYPVGVDEAKAKLKPLFASDKEAFIDSLTIKDFLREDTAVKLYAGMNKDQIMAVAESVAAIVVELRNKNVVTTLSFEGQGTAPIVTHITVPDIIVNVIAKASDNLFMSEEEITEETMTVKSLYDEAVFESGLSTEVDVLPWRIMSTFSRNVSSTIAKNTLLRVHNESYMKATQTVGYLLLQTLNLLQDGQNVEE